MGGFFLAKSVALRRRKERRRPVLVLFIWQWVGFICATDTGRAHVVALVRIIRVELFELVPTPDKEVGA